VPLPMAPNVGFVAIATKQVARHLSMPARPPRRRLPGSLGVWDNVTGTTPLATAAATRLGTIGAMRGALLGKQ
jgi:hypothetical protein